jgi:hypothetical protein
LFYSKYVTGGRGIAKERLSHYMAHLSVIGPVRIALDSEVVDVFGDV